MADGGSFLNLSNHLFGLIKILVDSDCTTSCTDDFSENDKQKISSSVERDGCLNS